MTPLRITKVSKGENAPSSGGCRPRGLRDCPPYQEALRGRPFALDGTLWTETAAFISHACASLLRKMQLTASEICKSYFVDATEQESQVPAHVGIEQVIVLSCAIPSR